MALGNPLRRRKIALPCAALGVCFGTALGCNVYDDELLRGRADTGISADDDGAAGDPPAVDGSSIVSTMGDASDTRNVDAAAMDGIAPDVGTGGDVSSPDATSDRGATGPDADDATPDDRAIDVIATSDATDTRFDATPDLRDADAPSTAADASDARVGDSGAADRIPPDTTSSTPDVASDADGGSAPPTFRVVRVGDGTTDLSSASIAAFVEERRLNGELVGNPIALPTSASGPQHPVTLSGNATSEGALSLSLDGRYLALAGYATAPGRPSVASSTNVDRVVARIDAFGAVDSTTRLASAFSGTNVRSAVSVDGTAFWIAGASGGAWYAALGGAGLTQIVSSPDNVRVVALFGDRLYGSSGVSPSTNVFTIGSGRPTAGPQDVDALPGTPRSGASPYAFVFFDRSPSVPGLDTLYLADDRSPETDGTGGGVQKWTFDGNAWSRVATFSAVGSGTASFRGVAGTVVAGGVVLVATTAEPGPNRLVLFVDRDAPNPTGTAIATAPNDTAFRGVALSPRP